MIIIKNRLFLITIIFVIIGLGYIKPVFALDIDEPKITGIEYVSDSSVKILYKTNNTNPNYKVQIYNMTNGKYYSNSVTSTDYTLTGLTTGKTYNIIMRVYYKTTVSNWSDPISATPKEGVPVINSIAVGDKQLTLNYNANGSPKEVEIYITNLKKSVKSNNLSSATITGLTNGTTYTFLMRNCYSNDKCSGWSTSKSDVPKVAPAPSPTTISGSSAIVAKAKELAWPLGSATSKHKEKGGAPTAAYQAAMDKYIGYSKEKKKKYKYARGVSCSVFVCAVVRASGYDKSWPTSVTSSYKHAKSSSKWEKISIKNAVAGDIFTYKNNNHIYIYGGKSGSKYLWYQANYGSKSGNGDYGYAFYGSSPSSKTNSYAWHATGTVKK